MIILKVFKVLLRNPPKGYAFKEESELLTDPRRKENQYRGWGRGAGGGEERKTVKKKKKA